MTQKSYWARRRFLQASGAGTVAAALLAACGGSSGTKSEDRSGLLTIAEDTEKIAKRGGTFKFYSPSDAPRGVDPYIREITTLNLNYRGYDNLWRLRPQVKDRPKEDVIEPMSGESWEVAPDKMSVTIKVRQGAHFDPRPPTSGRLLEAKDIAFSWDRFAQIGTLRADYANKVNPAAPIVSMTVIDPKTVSMKLAFPAADVFAQLADNTAGSVQIIPVETDGGFDIRREQRGSGPYYMSEYVPSSRFVFLRNPGYWDDRHPYIDRVELPILTEYAAAVAQLRAGAIYALPTIKGEDIVATKRAVPELEMSTALAPIQGNHVTFFGWADGPNSQFKDERVRQAYVMSWDRDLWIDTMFNVPKFEAEGLPVTKEWHSFSVPADRKGWWLDPQGKDFGPNAKYFQHNIADAKKLLAAAGFPDGFDTNAYYDTSGQLGGPDFNQRNEILLGFAREVGIRAKIVPVDYATDWRPKFSDVQGNFDGLAFRLASTATARSNLAAVYNKGGSLYQGWGVDGKTRLMGDPKMDELTDKINKEFDTKAANALAWELQRYDAQKVYIPKIPGTATGFQLNWPALRNYAAYYPGNSNYSLAWIDETRAPLKKA